MAASSAARPRNRLRPLVAHRALRELGKNPDDTTQAIVAIAALTGNSSERLFKRFKGSSEGRTILLERRNLHDLLSDRSGCWPCPPARWGARSSSGSSARTSAPRVSQGRARLAAKQFRRQNRGERRGAGSSAARVRNLHDVFHVLDRLRPRHARRDGRARLHVRADLATPELAYMVWSVGCSAAAGARRRVKPDPPGLPARSARQVAARPGLGGAASSSRSTRSVSNDSASACPRSTSSSAPRRPRPSAPEPLSPDGHSPALLRKARGVRGLRPRCGASPGS